VIAVDIRELDRNAVRYSVELTDQASAADLIRSTPCVGWSLGDLLSHMTAQHQGFAAAARGHGDDLAYWALPPVDVDLIARYREAASDVLDAFARLESLADRWTLPELSTEVTFSAGRAIGFHLIDYVVHGWDVARALGLPFVPPDGLAAAALPIAQAVPDGERRLEPGAPFAPRLPIPDQVSTIDRLLLLLGRDPDWSSPDSD
jgi:uncharacterized protein (TIGR03086 family)